MSKNIKKEQGFSLVEMLVVVSIIIVITTIVIVYYSNSGDVSATKNSADKIALTVRQAQTYALATRESEKEPGNFSLGYGVNFDTSNLNSFILFGDLNDNGEYNSGADELVENLEMEKSFVNIEDLCVYIDSVSPPQCISDGILNIDISFKKPTLGANINSNLGEAYAYAEIKISSDGKPEHKELIYIWNTGYVYQDFTTE